MKFFQVIITRKGHEPMHYYLVKRYFLSIVKYIENYLL